MRHARLRAVGEEPTIAADECRLGEVLDRVGDKWSVMVIDRLGGGACRFTDLLRTIDGVHQRALTLTLRGLERDGLVTRTARPAFPRRVDYALTPLGRTLLETIGPRVHWAEAHTADIASARATYDGRPPGSVRVSGCST